MLAQVTRIAPSPTGLFHLGTARTALFNWLAAKATGGRFILRIDDTDAARHVPEAVQVIDDALGWLGLDHAVRFTQSSRFDVYRTLARILVNKNAAYEEAGAIRLRLPESMPRSWHDTIAGEIAITDTELKVVNGVVLMRSDGTPTYHFASVVDDIDHEVTWVIRGHDHISNTAKQIAIACVLNELIAKDEWPMAIDPFVPLPFNPLWTHVGLLTHEGKKLSKRDGAASVLGYRDGGIHPEAMFNWLLRLGWGPNIDDKSVRTISRERAIELFIGGGGMRNSPAGMDIPLLLSLDRKYKGADHKRRNQGES